MWNVGDIAMCISAGPWYNEDRTEINSGPIPGLFHQYVVTDVSIDEYAGEDIEFLAFDEFPDEIWWSGRFVKADDPSSIKDDDVEIPVRKTENA